MVCISKIVICYFKEVFSSVLFIKCNLVCSEGLGAFLFLGEAGFLSNMRITNGDFLCLECSPKPNLPNAHSSLKM